MKKKAPKKAQALKKIQKALAMAVGEGTVKSKALAGAAKMVVSVEIDANHLVPYGVSWDGDLLLNGPGPESTTITVTPGHHVLSWFFNHKIETTWNHILSIAVDGGAAQAIDQKSSGAGNNPISGGSKVFDA